MHAFLYNGQQLSDLGALGGLSSVAVDINEADEVVGSSTASGWDNEHTFFYSEGL